MNRDNNWRDAVIAILAWLVVLFAIFLWQDAHADNLTNSQIRVLNEAITIGEKYN